jgi:hypothetical protein
MTPGTITQTRPSQDFSKAMLYNIRAFLNK